LDFLLSFPFAANHNISILVGHPGDSLARWQSAHRIALFGNFVQLFKQAGWIFIADGPDGRIMFVHQPPYRRFVPIGRTPLYKKQLSVLVQIFNIL
jgi:hypothetical protein